jgi:hypothetical protein
MPIKNDNFSTWMRKLAALAMVFVVTHTVYAVDGIIIKSNKSSKSSFSNMKKTLNISLNTGFTYRDNKSYIYRKSDSKVGNYNNVISFQKGNIKIMMPYRPKSVLQKFKTPEKPQQ